MCVWTIKWPKQRKYVLLKIFCVYYFNFFNWNTVDSVVPTSAVEQSNSVIYTHSIFNILVHYSLSTVYVDYNIPLYIYTTSSLPIYPVWTCRLSPWPGCCEWCCYKHRGACIFLHYSFVQVYAQEWDCWMVWQFYF